MAQQSSGFAHFITHVLSLLSEEVKLVYSLFLARREWNRAICRLGGKRITWLLFFISKHLDIKGSPDTVGSCSMSKCDQICICFSVAGDSNGARRTLLCQQPGHQHGLSTGVRVSVGLYGSQQPGRSTSK